MLYLRNPAYRCGEPAELVILEGTLGPAQTWMCPECQLLFRAPLLGAIRK
jgi:hypothetical protein